MSSPDLEIYLSPKGEIPGIGFEKGPKRIPLDGIVKYTSPHGSYRYVLFKLGRPISCIANSLGNRW